MALLTVVGTFLRQVVGGSHPVFWAAPGGVLLFLLAAPVARRRGLGVGTAMLCLPLLLLPLHAGLLQRSGAGTPATVLLIFAPLLATHVAGRVAGAVAALCAFAVLVALALTASDGTQLSTAAADQLRLLYTALTGLVGWLAIARSRSERDNAIAQIEALFDNAPATIVIKDREGRYVRVNRAFRDLVSQRFGRPVDPLGKTSQELFPEVAPALLPYERLVWESGVAHAFEHRFDTASGALDMLVTVFPVRAAAGTPAGIGAIALDISKRVQAETSMREASLELERSNQELQDFAAVVAHDLQAPARTVGMLANVLEEDLPNTIAQEDTEPLRHLVATTRRMESLVRRVLLYASVGRSQLTLETFTFGALVADVVEDNRADLAGVEVEVLGEQTQLTGDRGQLHQLVHNLVANGIKYRSPGRTPELTLDCVDGQDHWVIVVADNGIGMDKADLERIFEPFTRLGRSPGCSGSGIGLATCARIASRHGGKLWADSRPGEGSRFFFQFPKELSDAASKAA